MSQEFECECGKLFTLEKIEADRRFAESVEDYRGYMQAEGDVEPLCLSCFVEKMESGELEVCSRCNIPGRLAEEFGMHQDCFDESVARG